MSEEGEARWKENRVGLHDAIQRFARPSDEDLLEENESAASIVTNWVLVAEFVDTNGERWLARRESEGVTRWCVEGLLHNALYSDTWSSDKDVEG